MCAFFQNKEKGMEQGLNMVRKNVITAAWDIEHPMNVSLKLKSYFQSNIVSRNVLQRYF